MHKDDVGHTALGVLGHPTKLLRFPIERRFGVLSPTEMALSG